MPLEITAIQTADQQSFLAVLVQKLPSELPTLKVSVHAQSKRIMPASSPIPGKLDLSRTQFLIEPMDCMSPSSPIQRVIVLKGAQGGWTLLAECVLMYFIDHVPAPQLMITANQDGAEKWVAEKFEPAIDTYGARKKIKAVFGAEKNKRSGDKMLTKEYPGGSLHIVSAQSAASLRSLSKRVLVRDEIDGAPSELASGEGSFLDVSEARTNAFGNSKKIFDLSTPALFEDSLIFQAFLEGDQRIYLIPCPHCGHFQSLDSGVESVFSEFRMKPVRDSDGFLVDGYYDCVECGEEIREYHKATFLKAGKWVPTAKPSSKEIRSYHWSAVLSPVGMLSWKNVYEKYEASLESPSKNKAFTNLVRGLPYKELGGKPKLGKILDQVGNYKSGEIPFGVLYLTMSVDVQRGSKKDKSNPARLEYEVLGHGAGYRTWSIKYEKVIGPVDNIHKGAWKALAEIQREGGLKFKRKDGVSFDLSMIFIDSGTFTDVVYSFCSGWLSTFPIKGHSTKKKNKQIDESTLDEAGPQSFKRYSVSKIGMDVGNNLIVIHTNYYKNKIYRDFKITRDNNHENPNGFPDFPADYTEAYFKGLTIEEQLKDGSFRCPGGARNEPLDLRVYNLCAGDFTLDMRVKGIQAICKNKGATPAELEKIGKKYALELFQARIDSEVAAIGRSEVMGTAPGDHPGLGPPQ